MLKSCVVGLAAMGSNARAFLAWSGEIKRNRWRTALDKRTYVFTK